MTKKEKAIQYLENKRNILENIAHNLKGYGLNERLYNKVRREYAEEINLLDYIILDLRRSKWQSNNWFYY